MTSEPVRRVLVANRGEIAVRIIRACFDEGIEAVAAVSSADVDSLAARLADQFVWIGPAAATESYLCVSALVGAAIVTGCDAIHPGYGFLSERPELAEACTRHGIRFVGPTPEILHRGGNKVEAREMATSLGIPVGEGSNRADSLEEAVNVAESIGYPLLLKAAAGGGGKGMVLVSSEADLRGSFDRASHEAQQAFGDGTVYVERYVTNARHVEVQILADGQGSIVHLGERDCSCQRRYQKLVEEAPARALSEQLRRDLFEAAIALARELDYVGAGTVEFLVDLDRESFFFLEINTRLQVEHGVSEMVTGIDIVREQLRIAAGQRLSFRQSDVVIRGHAIECRINAESSARDFMPSPGTITRWTPPVGAGIRVDTHCFEGWQVTPNYDSLLAKLMTWGENREDAVQTMLRSLARFRIEGVETTVPLHQRLIGHGDFRRNTFNTKWVENTLLPGMAPAV